MNTLEDERAAELLDHVRPSVEALGSRGIMMHYTDPRIVVEQAAALVGLGLKAEAVEVLRRHCPLLAVAVDTKMCHAVDLETLEPKRDHYTYEGSDGHYYTGENYTWVARAHYELQTLALHSLMDLLETGSLEGVDLDLYRVGLGDTSVCTNSFMAFNYNPERQPYNFFNVLKARFVREGLGEVKVNDRVSHINVPSFFWAGLDNEARARVATHLLRAKYPAWDRWDFITTVMAIRGGIDFGDLIEKALTHHRQLHGPVLKPDTMHTMAQGDWKRPVVRMSYVLTDAGFTVTEHKRLYYSDKDRREGGALDRDIAAWREAARQA